MPMHPGSRFFVIRVERRDHVSVTAPERAWSRRPADCFCSSLRRTADTQVRAARRAWIGITPGCAQSPRRKGSQECQTMSELHPANTSRPRAAPLRAAARDDARQDPLDGRTLYVLGFGIAGGILANAIPLVYFASLYASR